MGREEAASFFPTSPRWVAVEDHPLVRHPPLLFSGSSGEDGKRRAQGPGISVEHGPQPLGLGWEAGWRALGAKCSMGRTQGLLALHLARGLVQGVPQDGVLLLQAGQLRTGAVLQLLLQRPDLKGHPRGIRTSQGQPLREQGRQAHSSQTKAPSRVLSPKPRCAGSLGC